MLKLLAFGHVVVDTHRTDNYPVFKPGDTPIFMLPEDKVEDVTRIYKQMMEELHGDFVYKYDVLRTHVQELIFTALRMQPASGTPYGNSNASLRVASLFTELLERQFPIESVGQRMKFRSPVDFAAQLSVHVNHLNRSLKEITGKTTSQLIRERVIQEAKALLMHTGWNISEIAWCLGFEELPHFINYFKKEVQLSPKTFRQTALV
ncbi:MAG: AraC family transcriptional regulator [Sphingobacteriales bacterium]|nr:MAG: AraC family transcriptional regulator [Sphingobacteriales bacterium]